jgi:hypothetical protein
MRLLRRSNPGPPSGLVCSTFGAAVLVALGCLANDTRAWNALPADFLSLPFHCGCGNDVLIV